MKFSVDRDSLLRPLQQAAGVIETRQTRAVLANLLFEVADNQLSMTGTDLEIELVARLEVTQEAPGSITVQARKLVDICREIPEKAKIEFTLDKQRLEVKSGRFRSSLTTLPANDFPTIKRDDSELSTQIGSKALSKLFNRTAFAMAQRDVRYFLNGMLLEMGAGRIRAVATDGHRLALSEFEQKSLDGDVKQVILPRKAVLEIQRLVQDMEEDISVSVGPSHMYVSSSAYTMTTRLLDGMFPDYDRVIPKNGDKVVTADRLPLRQAVNRTAILSNEKLRGIRVTLEGSSLRLSANNPEQEEAEETVLVEYDGSNLEIGFNVTYLQDVLGALESDKVQVTLLNTDSSAVIQDAGVEESIYIVMPMKL